MSFKLSDFTASPSQELLDLVKKSDLLDIAEHYGLPNVEREERMHREKLEHENLRLEMEEREREKERERQERIEIEKEKLDFQLKKKSLNYRKKLNQKFCLWTQAKLLM